MSTTTKVAKREKTDETPDTTAEGNADTAAKDNADPEVAAMASNIEATRASMASTVNAIEERLSPAHIKEKIADIKDAVVDQLKDAKDKIKDDLAQDLQQAKSAVREELAEAKGLVRGELREAKHVVREEIDHVKSAAYDATIGKVSHMYDDARESVTEAGGSILGTIRANPIPAALIAVGVGWLFMNARSAPAPRGRRLRTDYDRDDEGYLDRPRAVLARGQRAVSRAAHTVEEGAYRLGHRIQDGAGSVVERVGGLAHDVGERAGHLAHDVGDTASNLAHRASDRAEHFVHDARDAGLSAVRSARGVAVEAGHGVVRAEQSVERAYDSYPLAFGAGAVAVGLAVGLSLPHTRQEDEWLGGVKDQVVERARDAAREAIEQAEEKVDSMASLATTAQKVVRRLSPSDEDSTS